MKISIYKKAWIIYIISLIVVIPIFIKYSLEFDYLEKQSLAIWLILMFYLQSVPITLIFIYVSLWIKKKQDQYIEKTIEKPEKDREVRIFTIKMSAIGCILSLVAVYILIFVEYDFNIKSIIALAIMIIGIIPLIIAFYKQITM